MVRALAFRERMIAIRVSVSDITNGQYGESDGPFVVSPYGIELRRVVLLGFIVEKRSGQTANGKYAYVTIDDGTDTIKAWAWDIHVESLEKVENNILALIIGKVKSFKDDIYIAPEIIRKIDDPNFMTYHMMERYQTILTLAGSSEVAISAPPHEGVLQETLGEPAVSARPSGKLGNLIYEYIKENLGSDGIKIDEIVAHFLPMGYKKSDVNLEVLELQQQGLLQEIKVGHYTLGDQ
jgi:RPA family protein